MAKDVDQIAECYYRIHEFREWVKTNILFPEVPDKIVHPLLTELRNAELTLVGVLYEKDALSKITAMHTILKVVK